MGKPMNSSDASGCDHKFVDSKNCLKCGWAPPKATETCKHDGFSHSVGLPCPVAEGILDAVKPKAPRLVLPSYGHGFRWSSAELDSIQQLIDTQLADLLAFSNELSKRIHELETRIPTRFEEVTTRDRPLLGPPKKR